jgi:hypothetical protein
VQHCGRLLCKPCSIVVGCCVNPAAKVVMNDVCVPIDVSCGGVFVESHPFLLVIVCS